MAGRGGRTQHRGHVADETDGPAAMTVRISQLQERDELRDDQAALA
ncbi:hypothetical protein [Modestobacter marinus]|nr:hypothetical protein [Modestobacter marinus]